MAAKEMYDYLATATPDYAATLSVTPQQIVVEEGGMQQVVHVGDDGSEERVSFDDTPIFYIMLGWSTGITASDAGTIFDWYYDAAKANGIVKSFRWTHPTDGHTYVVRFTATLERSIAQAGSIHKITRVRLKVLGTISD